MLYSVETTHVVGVKRSESDWVNAPTSQSFANYVLLALVYGSVVLYKRKPLKTKYKFKKFAGVVLCVAGLVMVVFSDVHANDGTAGNNPVKGDILVIAGSTLYAFSNVSEEFLVKSADMVELMAMLGLFGAIISAYQMYPSLLRLARFVAFVICHFYASCSWELMPRAFRKVSFGTLLKNPHMASIFCHLIVGIRYALMVIA
ncbi:Solute carrier family 35 member F2-like protein [Drosera capensis]